MQNNTDLNTNLENMSSPIIYTGFRRRLFARIIDSLIIAIPGMTVGGSINNFGISIGMSTVIGFFYFPIFESSQLCATPGKALMNMSVLTENSQERISFRAAIIRYFVSYLSALICYIGYLMQIFTTKRQTLHDMISETIVIDRKMPDLNYFTVWKDQFKSIIKKI